MREWERIRESLKGIRDAQVRSEILEAQGVLMNTFAEMMKEARGALRYRKSLFISLNEAEKATEILKRYVSSLEGCLPKNRKELIDYIVRLGRGAILLDDEKRSVSAGQTLYAASNEDGYAGVYSSTENARRAGFDNELNLIPIVLVKADAAPKHYVCMAEGTWTSMRMNDGRCTTEICSIQPVWGFSIQDCMSAINRMRLNQVALKSLYIYEIDRTYPYLLNAADRFQSLFKEYAEQSMLPQKILAVDYIQQYFDEISHEAEYIEKYYSEDTQRILRRISEIYGLNMAEKKWMRTELCRRLSKEELLEKEEMLDHMESCMLRRRG